MSDMRARHPLLLGHRGARAQKSIPENTIASFDQALADGCDGFEFDVRLTADGHAVICHDPEFEGSEIARSSAKEVSQLPQFEDICTRYQDSAFLDIELKVPGLERLTIELLRKHPLHRGCVVSSFLPEVLNAIHVEDATIPLGLICETKSELSGWPRLPVKFVIPHHTLATESLIRDLKAVGVRILVWTVNDAADMQRFAALGVDGIISDDTGLLCKTLSH
jgi:glycerophosphoryl diester phosphodiesterase